MILLSILSGVAQKGRYYNYVWEALSENRTQKILIIPSETLQVNGRFYDAGT